MSVSSPSLSPERLARISALSFASHSTTTLAAYHLYRSVADPAVHPAAAIGSYSLAAIAAAKLSHWISGSAPSQFSVWWRAAFLGTTLASGVMISYDAEPQYSLFGWYTVIMSVFHFFEYYVTALSNPGNLSTDSFLLNHSVAYGVAAAVSWAEFGLEASYAPSIKLYKSVAAVGAAVCVGGDLLRKVSMLQAGRSFNHIVQNTKREDHRLVTDGAYRWFRHPSYVGWLYWSVGTQVVLCNPVCAVIYALVSWKFFADRVVMEEWTLLHFFGDDYHRYQQEVGTGLPFIRGYRRPSIASPKAASD